MKIPFEVTKGKIIHITFKEFLARLWPFGKWFLVWKHVIDGEHLSREALAKHDAVQAFYLHKNLQYMKVVRIKKEGGLFHGIEYTPRTREQKNIQR